MGILLTGNNEIYPILSIFISGNKHMWYCSLADEDKRGKGDREGIERKRLQ